MRKIASRLLPAAGAMALVAALGGIAIAQQDKNTVRTPNGLGFADFQGYESWQVVSVSATPGVIDVIVGNPAMIAAYKTGLPADGKKFPDGVKMAKIHWITAQNSEGGSPATVPGQRCATSTSCGATARASPPAAVGAMPR